MCFEDEGGVDGVGFCEEGTGFGTWFGDGDDPAEGWVGEGVLAVGLWGVDVRI